jgi:hypothetical protein
MASDIILSPCYIYNVSSSVLKSCRESFMEELGTDSKSVLCYDEYHESVVIVKSPSTSEPFPLFTHGPRIPKLCILDRLDLHAVRTRFLPITLPAYT